MQLLFLEQWLNEQLLKTFCWTLIHSLWQGLVAAALAGLVILFTRQSTARTRYNMLGAILVLFILSSLVTFIIQLSIFSGNSSPATILSDLTSVNVIETDQQVIPQSAGTINLLIDWLNENAGLFMGWWAVFFLFNAIKLLTGIGSVNRLCRHRVHQPGNEWIEKVSELGQSLGLTQKVRLLQSELVKVPVTFGYLKPVILLPVGLLAHLPADQVETILIHELAHIRRRDYLVNLIQKFTESIYFFNPALLWISSLIRQEREACCDDIVMENIQHRSSYLNALVSFQELNLAGNNYAMTIATKRNYLLNRVKRMLTRENKNLNLMEKVFLSTGIVLLMAFSFMPDDNAKKPVTKITVSSPLEIVTPSTFKTTPVKVLAIKPVVSEKKKFRKVIPQTYIDTPDTTKNKKPVVTDGISAKSVSINSNDDGKTKTENTTIIDQNGKKYTMNKVNNKVTALSVDGKDIPESEFNKHSDLIHQIESTVNGRKERAVRAEKERRESDHARRESLRVHQDRKEVARLNEEKARIQSRERDEIKRINDQYRKQEEINRKRDSELRERQRKEVERVKERNRKQIEMNKQQQQEIQRKMKNTTQMSNNVELTPLTKTTAAVSSSKLEQIQSRTIELKPIKVESVKLEVVKSHTVEVEHPKVESVKLEDVKSRTLELKPIKAESLKLSPVKTETLKAEPSKPTKLKVEPIKYEPSSKSAQGYKPETKLKAGRPIGATKRSFT